MSEQVPEIKPCPRCGIVAGYWLNDHECPTAKHDDYVAWCCYIDDGNRIVLCDSDAKGAFKVYAADQLAAAVAEARREVWEKAISAVDNIMLPAIASAQYAYIHDGIEMARSALAAARTEDTQQ